MRHRGFTLIELLLAVGIIALLMSLVVVGMGHARTAASRTKTLSSMRGVIAGYAAYTEDHRGALIPGMLTAQQLQQFRIEAIAIDDAPLGAGTGYADGSSWVWRLMPYIDDGWEALVTDYGDAAVKAAIAQELGAPNPAERVYGPATADPGDGDIGLAKHPSIGLNATFFGGNSIFGDNDALARSPWGTVRPSIAAEQAAEVRNASRAIVFATTRDVEESEWPVPDAGTPDLVWGSPEVRAPYLFYDEANDVWSKQQWSLAGEEANPDGHGAWDRGGGIPYGRWGSENIPTAHFDGSTSVMKLGELQDMRNWSPFAVGRLQ